MGDSIAEYELRKNQHLVTIEPIEFEKYPAEVETTGKSPVMLEESIEQRLSLELPPPAVLKSAILSPKMSSGRTGT